MFKIYEFIGIEILKENNKINTKYGLIIDDIVEVGNGRGRIYQNNDNLYVDFGSSFGILEFDKDDRHCWICSVIVNKNISKIKLPCF